MIEFVYSTIKCYMYRITGSCINSGLYSVFANKSATYLNVHLCKDHREGIAMIIKINSRNWVYI